ncbi:efflux RND transporter periplasmic adaptor subunit [Pseudomonas sp. NPDC087358]|uniref:efflux RND transporter periplasmic adaptor subunit n=1 Tax=Pseudomonas sp. NPDC087358 TaxID=3364439 RepID=UPI00384A8CE5
MKTVHYLKTHNRPIASAVAMAVAGLLTLNLAGCNDASGKPADAAVAPGAVVSAATVIEKGIIETQEFSGRMEAIERVDIRARVGGFITSVNVNPGAIVKKGDVLFVIDPRPYQAEANRTEAAAAAARAKVELARIELARSLKLIGEKAIAQRELDEASANFKELDASARAAEAQYENARLNLSYTRVTTPIDGRVGKADITLGNLVDTSAVLTKVVSDDRIYATFDGDEDTYLRVGKAHHNGKDVNVKVGLANEQGFPHEGKLEFVDNQLDPQTGGVRMRAIFVNADKSLAPGLFARVQLQGGTEGGNQSQTVLINERAISTDQDRKFVFVVNPQDQAEYRQVTLGATVDGLRIVRSGLKAGEKIVVNGLPRVMPGATLAPHMVSMDFDPDAPVVQATSDAKPDTKAKG